MTVTVVVGFLYILKETHTDKKFITLTHHNKSTEKIAKSLKKLEYNIAYTQTTLSKDTPQQNHAQHQTRKTHIHRYIQT